MNSAKKILFFVLFVWKEFTSGIAVDSSEEHDITKPLNEAIIKIFQCANPVSAMKLVSYMESRKRKYQCQNFQTLHPFRKKIFFHDINISIWEPEFTPKLYCEFHKNKTRIFNSVLIFKVIGNVDTEPGKTYAGFATHAKFKDFAITATESSTRPYNNQFEINFSYSRLSNYLVISSCHCVIPRHKQEKLIKKLRTVIPSMIHENTNFNERFVNALKSSFCHNPTQNIISTYPDFAVNDQKYYYYISKNCSLGSIEVKIKGLSNFEWLRPNNTYGETAYTLLVKHIRGSIRTYSEEVKNLKFHEMNFYIKSLYVTADFETKRLVVEARDYNITHVISKHLIPPQLSTFSAIIMQYIETAISLELMPALKVPDADKLNYTFTPPDSVNSPFAHEVMTEKSANTELSNDATGSTVIIQKNDLKPRRNTKSIQITSSLPVNRVIINNFPDSEMTTRTTKTSKITQKIPLTQGWYIESTATSRRPYYSRLFEKESFVRRIITLNADLQTNVRKREPITKSTGISTRIQITTQTSSKIDVKKPQRPSDSTTRTTLSSIITDEKSHLSSTQRIESLAKQTKANMHDWMPPKVNEPEIKSIAEVEEDDFDYDISFHNVTIKLIRGTHHPKHIQCGFSNTLKIDHQIKAVPFGNIHLINKGNSINIRFHANFTAIKISVIKPNSSQGNDSCEFQIHNNQGIKVVVPSAKNTSKSNANIQMKKKLDNTLMSMMKERITQHLKPLVCLPLDICSQSIQMVDNFFLNFVDDVLKKCLLRRNATTTLT